MAPWLVCDSSPLCFHVECQRSLSLSHPVILVNTSEMFVQHIFIFTAEKMEVTLYDVQGDVCRKYCQVNHHVPVGSTLLFSPCCTLSDLPPGEPSSCGCQGNQSSPKCPWKPIFLFPTRLIQFLVFKCLDWGVFFFFFIVMETISAMMTFMQARPSFLFIFL